MDYEFSSLDELKKRVTPALRTKESEYKRLGYEHLKESDIWNYLIETKWKNGKDLMLSDIVSDIMHTTYQELNEYLKNKLSGDERAQYFDKNVEII
jgi:hypothetical protein